MLLRQHERRVKGCGLSQTCGGREREEGRGLQWLGAFAAPACCGRSKCWLVPEGQKAGVACRGSCPLGAMSDTALGSNVAPHRAEMRRGSGVRPVAV